MRYFSFYYSFSTSVIHNFFVFDKDSKYLPDIRLCILYPDKNYCCGKLKFMMFPETDLYILLQPTHVSGEMSNEMKVMFSTKHVAR